MNIEDIKIWAEVATLLAGSTTVLSFLNNVVGRRNQKKLHDMTEMMKKVFLTQDEFIKYKIRISRELNQIWLRVFMQKYPGLEDPYQHSEDHSNKEIDH